MTPNLVLNHFIVLVDSEGQEPGWGNVWMACPCSTMLAGTWHHLQADSHLRVWRVMLAFAGNLSGGPQRGSSAELLDVALPGGCLGFLIASHQRNFKLSSRSHIKKRKKKWGTLIYFQLYWDTIDI